MMPLSQSQLQKALECLEAGNWQGAHEIVQQDEESALACWAHGIVHIMEGDLPNARYWYRKAKRRFPDDPSVIAEIRALEAAADGAIRSRSYGGSRGGERRR